MVYTNTQPASTQLVSQGQGTIQANFLAIDTGTSLNGIGFSRNHVTMTDATNGGLHSRVDYYQAVSSPTISEFVSSAYPKNVTYSAAAGTPTYVEYFYKNATSDIQATNTLLTTGSFTSTLAQGMLPGGLTMQCGKGNTNGVAIVFAFPFPTACIGVVATTFNSGAQVNVSSISSSQFLVVSPSGNVGFFYIAFGY